MRLSCDKIDLIALSWCPFISFEQKVDITLFRFNTRGNADWWEWIFTARCSYASAALEIENLTVAALTWKLNESCGILKISVWLQLRYRGEKVTKSFFYMYHERAITLVFWQQQWLVVNAYFCLKCALKVTHRLRKTTTSTDFRL